MQKYFAMAMLAAVASVLIGASFEMSALAQSTQTLDNVKKVVIKTTDQTLILNLNSIAGQKGDKGDPGKDGINGTNGQNGAPGRDGINGTNGVNGKDGRDGVNGTNGINGRDGTNGTNGKDGVTIVAICTGVNDTNPLCPQPTPVPPVNGTGNLTK